MNLLVFPHGVSAGMVSITVGGEQSGYPIENMEDRDYNTQWMNDTAAETVTLDIDYGENITPDYLILGNHNYTNPARGIKFCLDANNNGAYSSLTYLVGSAAAYHDYTGLDLGIWLETFTNSTACRYFRLILEGTSAVKVALGFRSRRIGNRYQRRTEPEL